MEIQIIIANILNIIAFLIALYAANIINRRKSYFIDTFSNVLSILIYFLLGSYRTTISSIYACLKRLYVFKFHKEQKLIYSLPEALILTLPYIIIGLIAFYKTHSIFLLICSCADCMSSMIFIIKKDTNRFLIKIIIHLIWGLNDAIYYNFVGIIQQATFMIICMKNLYLVHKNGEEKYYKIINKLEQDNEI